jgi:phage terminase large subunit-like protein
VELFALKVGDWFETIEAKFSQSMKSIPLQIEQFKEAYLTGMITSGGNPVMTWMLDCVGSSTDSNGNVKLTKPKLERTKTRIEGVIASIMSINTAEDNEGQGTVDGKEDFVFSNQATRGDRIFGIIQLCPFRVALVFVGI